MINIKITDIQNKQQIWFHFDTFNEAVDVINSALMSGYEISIDKAEKE